MVFWTLCLETQPSFCACLKPVLMVASPPEEVVMGRTAEEVAGASEGRR